MRNSCNADRRPVAAVLLSAPILTGTLMWNCIAYDQIDQARTELNAVSK